MSAFEPVNQTGLDILTIDSSVDGFLTSAGVPVRVRLVARKKNWFGGPFISALPSSIPYDLESSFFSMEFFDGIQSVRVEGTVSVNCVTMAQSVLNAEYLWGGKGWDVSRAAFVDPENIKSSTYNGGSLKTKEGWPNPAPHRGVDCSGLVFWACNKAANAQKKALTNPVFYETAAEICNSNAVAIEEGELEPGDLMCFKFERDGKVPAHHVAMYVGGDQFIHATSNVVPRGGTPNSVVYASKNFLKSVTDGKGNVAFRNFARLAKPTKPGVQIRAHSPVSLVVIDPEGYTITAETEAVTETEILREITGHLYYSAADMDDSGRADDLVYAPRLKPGVYLIKVVPKEGVLPTETYGLDIEAGGTRIVLAEKVAIADIPVQGYAIASTGTEISLSGPVASPVISWPAPATIVRGTPLSSVQLNATANVPGTFTYSPPLGTVLPIGAGQTLSVTFTPADAANTTTAQIQVAIDVVAPGPAQPAMFHAIGDLPGGPVASDVRDATNVGGVLYAVGASASHDQTLCISFNNPAGCVMQHNPDTALLWTFDGVNRTLTPLPDVVTPTGTPVNPLFASAITRDAAYIASQARSNIADPAQMHAVRVTRTGLLNLDLSAAPFPPNNQPAAAQAISEDGSIVYGVDGVPFRARRFDVTASTSVRIPLLSGSDTASFIAARGVSFDGSVAVGTSFAFPFTGTNGRAFRYVHAVPVGTVAAIPLLPGGTWSKALAVSPDGRQVLVAGNSTFLPNGEIYLYDAVTGTATTLGSPNTPWAPVSIFAASSLLIVNFAGMTADGSVVAVTFADPTDNSPIRHGSAYIHNGRGWFHFTTIVGKSGIDIYGAGWESERFQINGISPDGTLVFGSGRRNGHVEGFVAEFSPGYLASFDVAPLPQTDTAIVGVWTENGNGGDAAVFLADGTYFHIDTRHGTQTPSEHISGFERGRYRWDAASGAFFFATLHDTNGSVGLSGGNGLIGLTATVSGDTLDIANGGIVLTRVTAAASSIVGGWVFGDPAVEDSGRIVAFFPDGTFMSAEDGSSAAHPSGRDGVEGGTYTWSPDTGAFTINVTIDTNGGWGFSNGPGSASRTAVLSPDQLRLGFSGDANQLLRIVDPRTVVPVITSTLSTVATAGYPFAYQIAATRAPSSYGAAGLPPGVGIDAATGLISGTPAQAGIFDVTISASNTLSTGSAPLRLAVISPLTTPVGNDVVVTPGATPGAEPVPVSIRFETVTQSGVTAIAEIDPATVPAAQQLPSGFSLGDPPLYYEIQTTALFSGPVTVCFNYAGSSVSGFPRLLHYEAALANWVDITTTVDTSAGVVCGLTSSFSPFAIAASALAGVGFHAPVSPIAGAPNAVKGGSTVPLKFNVYAQGPIEITSAEAIANLSFTVTQVACTGGAAAEVVPPTTTGSTSLRYDASAHQFVQNWQTPKTPGCYLVRVLGDGLLLSAKFTVK
jgi:cell wall-associated NlpC family hydrolase